MAQFIVSFLYHLIGSLTTWAAIRNLLHDDYRFILGLFNLWTVIYMLFHPWILPSTKE